MSEKNLGGAVAVKAPGMALDLVEMGTEEELDRSKHGKISDVLPEGVTSGMMYKDVVRIAWPSMVELTLTQLASMVDMMMVGQLGPWAIAAIGLTTQPKFLVMTMFMAMNVGATAMVARCKGAGTPERANLMLRQAILMTFVFSTVSAILGYVFANPLINFMGGASDSLSLQGGVEYFRIQMIGLPFLALTSTATATLRGVGNSRTAMIYNLIANVVNVVFNYLLINGHFGFPRMEVAGASLATIIGQTVAFVLAFITLMSGRNYLHLSLTDGFKPNKEAMSSITKIGVPAMIEQLVMRAGMIMFTRMVTSLGDIAFATHNVCMNIQAMSFMNGQAFAVSATSLTGQSLGKKRIDMAQAYIRRTRRVGMFVSIVIALICFFFGRQLISLYTDELEIITLGAIIMMIVAVVQPLQSSQFILAGSLRGAGDTRSIAIITTITMLIIRPLLAYILIYPINLGLLGAWIALVIDQVTRSGFVMFRYYSGKWRGLKV